MRIRTGRVTAIVAAAVAALVLVVAGGASPGTARIDGIPQRGTGLGAKAAQVTLIRYEVLGCTHCNEYTQNAFPTIVREYVRPGLVKIGTTPPKLIRPDAYDGDAFRTILDQALGR